MIILDKGLYFSTLEAEEYKKNKRDLAAAKIQGVKAWNGLRKKSLKMKDFNRANHYIEIEKPKITLPAFFVKKNGILFFKNKEFLYSLKEDKIYNINKINPWERVDLSDEPAFQTCYYFENEENFREKMLNVKTKIKKENINVATINIEESQVKNLFKVASKKNIKYKFNGFDIINNGKKIVISADEASKLAKLKNGSIFLIRNNKILLIKSEFNEDFILEAIKLAGNDVPEEFVLKQIFDITSNWEKNKFLRDLTNGEMLLDYKRQSLQAQTKSYVQTWHLTELKDISVKEFLKKYNQLNFLNLEEQAELWGNSNKKILIDYILDNISIETLTSQYQRVIFDIIKATLHYESFWISIKEKYSAEDIMNNFLNLCQLEKLKVSPLEEKEGFYQIDRKQAKKMKTPVFFDIVNGETCLFSPITEEKYNRFFQLYEKTIYTKSIFILQNFNEKEIFLIEELGIQEEELKEWVRGISMEDFSIALKSIYIEGLGKFFLRDFLNLKEHVEAIEPSLIGRRIDYKNIKIAHDFYLNHRRVLENNNIIALFRDRYEAFKDFKIKINNENLFIIAPREIGDLIEEGVKNQHCMDTYGQHIEDGQEMVLFARLKRNEPLYAFSLNEDGIIIQSSGKAHAAVPYEILRGLENHFQKVENLVNVVRFFYPKLTSKEAKELIEEKEKE